MIESIEIGKNYSIKLSNIYGALKQNVNIIGTTTIDNVTKNQDEYNIYETYFKPMGLGLTTYYTAIDENTVIYICASITNLTPLTVDSKEKVFIPNSIIDLQNSYEYVPVMNLSFNIYPILEGLIPDEHERILRIDELVKKIKNRLGTLIEFHDSDIDVEPYYDIVHMEKESLEHIEKKRIEEYDNFIKRQTDIRNNNDHKENLFNQRYNDMEVSKMLYENARKRTEGEQERLYRLIEHYEQLIKEKESTV